MGQTSSTTIEERILEDESLQRLCGSIPITDHGIFWHDLRASLSELSLKSSSSSFPLPLMNPKLVEKCLSPVVDKLLQNNANTRHLGGFMITLSEWLCEGIRHSAISTENPAHETNIDYLINGLLIFRVAAHIIIAECSTDQTQMQIHFNTLPNGLVNPGIRSVAATLLESMFRYLCESPVGPANFLIHLEVLHCLFVLFSTTFYGGLSNEEIDETIHQQQEGLINSNLTFDDSRRHNIFLEAAMSELHFSAHIPVKLVQILIHTYVTYRLALKDPSPLQKSIQSTLNKTMTAVFGTIGLAASTLLYLPLSAYKTVFNRRNSELDYGKHISESFPKLIGKRSLMVLLLLLFYRKNDPTINNPYLNAFRNFSNLDELKAASTPTISEYELETFGDNLELMSTSVFHLSFRKVFRSIIRDFEDEDSTLLTYSLLNENTLFLEYVLSRPDTDTILLPLLHKLYHSQVDTKPNHIYMMLIILMILTQDVSFNQNMQAQTINNPTWYKERILGNINLGSLVTIILIKTIQHNITHQKDLYMNNNCLAIISNMAPYFENMHTLAAQRLVFLMHILSNKYRRLVKKNSPADEIETYLKFLQMSIETVNSCLTYALKRNHRLVYELLYKRSVIGNLRRMGVFPQLVNNIEIIIQFFGQQLQQAEGEIPATPQNMKQDYLDTLDTPSFNQDAENKFFSRSKVLSFDEDIDQEDSEYMDYSNGKKTWTVEEILDIIERGFKLWTAKDHKLILFEHLPYKYTEDANTEAFFMPYLWLIIVNDADYCSFMMERALMMLPIETNINTDNPIVIE